MILYAVIMIIVVVILVRMAFSYAGQIGEIEDAYKELVGMEVVYKKDTLMIVDYSMLNTTLTLSDGSVVSVELAKALTPVIREDD